jgi:hypothetical protein
MIRWQAASADAFRSGIAKRLPAGFDLDASARTHGALRRAREVRSGTELLRLALLYATSGLSLRGSAAWAEAAGLAALSDVALLKRLRSADGWLGSVVEALLSAAIRGPEGVAPRRVRPVDATMTCGPGACGGRWRVHADYDLGRGRFIGFALTDERGAESLERFAPIAGDIFVADRYYAKARQLRHVVAGGADFVVRRGLTGCRLWRRGGGKFDLASALRAARRGRTLDLPVLVPPPDGADDAPIPARLVIRRLDDAAARAARRQAQKKAAKNGQRAKDKRLQAAEHIMLLTSLDAEAFPAARVFELYRLRWQIEIAFKRLKGIVGLADLPAKDPRLARACLYAKLIAAAIGDDILQGLLDSPPCAPDIPALAMATASTRLSRSSRPRPRPHQSRRLRRPPGPPHAKSR